MSEGFFYFNFIDTPSFWKHFPYYIIIINSILKRRILKIDVKNDIKINLKQNNIPCLLKISFILGKTSKERRFNRRHYKKLMSTLYHHLSHFIHTFTHDEIYIIV